MPETTFEEPKKKGSGGIVDISRVPRDFDGVTQRVIYNPLDEDFTHNFNGRPHTIPAKTEVVLVDFLADHLAKHLSEKIVSEQHLIALKTKETADRPASRMLEAVPEGRIAEVKKALLKGEAGFLKDEPNLVETTTGPEVGKDITPNVPDYDKMGWGELRKIGKEKGIFKVGMKKQELISALKVRL